MILNSRALSATLKVYLPSEIVAAPHVDSPSYDAQIIDYVNGRLNEPLCAQANLATDYVNGRLNEPLCAQANLATDVLDLDDDGEGEYAIVKLEGSFEHMLHFLNAYSKP